MHPKLQGEFTAITLAEKMDVSVGQAQTYINTLNAFTLLEIVGQTLEEGNKRRTSIYKLKELVKPAISAEQLFLAHMDKEAEKLADAILTSFVTGSTDELYYSLRDEQGDPKYSKDTFIQVKNYLAFLGFRVKVEEDTYVYITIGEK